MLLSSDPPADHEDLVTFIEQVTKRGSGAETIVGNRNMVDLCDIAKKYYFHPSTMGSSSLKKVLPALMKSSPILRALYQDRTYGQPVKSLNFKDPVAWWQLRDGEVVDPYLLLPPLFDDVPMGGVDAAEEGLSQELQHGGAAMTAYGRLQFESLPQALRQSMKSGLLRYCELDTLAMVMAVQAWKEACRSTPPT